MKRVFLVSVVLALLALSATQLFAIQTGTWTCLGYTITVTPDDPENPNLSGVIEIVKSDDYADVVLEGTYATVKEPGKKAILVVDIAGTVSTPDGIMDVGREFKFNPGPQKTVWKTVLTWIDSQIVG
jgi:hypothetical protein